ncbi:MAG TPA: EthD family reductase [Azospirillaceae bacterium]|nr:EthD family reductase [Azospirillaceae bacterium]
MHKLLVLYGHPADPDHFRRYYTATHAPLAERLPGLRESRYSFDVQGLGGPSPYFCVFEGLFDDAAALDAALKSETGAKVVADVPNYATGGVTIVHFDV